MKPKVPSTEHVQNIRVPREHVEAAEALKRLWYSRTPREQIYFFPPELAKVYKPLPTTTIHVFVSDSPVRTDFPVSINPAHEELLQKVSSGFKLVDLLVPKRLSNEEIGDALEVISALMKDPNCPRWKVWLKVFTTRFWISVNALRNVTSALLGKRAE